MPKYFQTTKQTKQSKAQVPPVETPTKTNLKLLRIVVLQGKITTPGESRIRWDWMLPDDLNSRPKASIYTNNLPLILVEQVK